MPDEYDDFRRKLSNYEKGLYFELGRAHEQGETPEKGWVRQFEIRTSEGPRVLDSARTEGRGVQGKERKSGRVNELETGKQLDKERAGLESGQLTRSLWETVAGERIPPAVAAKMQAMSRDFGDKFQHAVISRDDALRAMKLGQSLMSKQLELVRAYELNRADRARKRLEKIREIVRFREGKANDGRDREREPQQRGVAKAWERENQSPERVDLVRKLDTPAREQSQVRTTEQPQQKAPESRAFERELAAQARPQQPPNSPPAPQRTPEQEREAARAFAKEAGISRELMGIMGLNSSGPHPTIDLSRVPTPAELAADRSRHRRERERAERERDRTRERGR